MKAIRLNETGGQEVMHLEEIETLTPKAGEVLIKIAAAGINYADLMQRQGTYMTRTRTPMTMGFEVAGTVEALGANVTSPGVGSRVVALTGGGYAEYTTAPANTVISIPENLDLTHAAAFPVQGITAYQLLRESAHLQQGESVLVHAAACGVGTLAVQLARLMGAGKVIGTASNSKKLELVKELGADAAIVRGCRGRRFPSDRCRLQKAAGRRRRIERAGRRRKGSTLPCSPPRRVRELGMRGCNRRWRPAELAESGYSISTGRRTSMVAGRRHI